MNFKEGQRVRIELKGRGGLKLCNGNDLILLDPTEYLWGTIGKYLACPGWSIKLDNTEKYVRIEDDDKFWELLSFEF